MLHFVYRMEFDNLHQIPNFGNQLRRTRREDWATLIFRIRVTWKATDASHRCYSTRKTKPKPQKRKDRRWGKHPTPYDPAEHHGKPLPKRNHQGQPIECSAVHRKERWKERETNPFSPIANCQRTHVILFIHTCPISTRRERCLSWTGNFSHWRKPCFIKNNYKASQGIIALRHMVSINLNKDVKIVVSGFGL